MLISGDGGGWWSLDQKGFPVKIKGFYSQRQSAAVMLYEVIKRSFACSVAGPVIKQANLFNLSLGVVIHTTVRVHSLHPWIDLNASFLLL